MDATQWPREAALAPPSGGGRANPPVSAGMERRTHRQNDQPLNCPRCNSNVTKFCYYNNYSLTQPRYFCKTCRRYWTEGGSLRNVPVGGGSRKNKRSSVAAAAAAKPPGALTSSSSSIQNPKFTEVQDLNIGFSHGVGGLPELESFSNMELLRGIEIGGGPIRSFIQVPHEVYSTGFGLQDFRGRSTLGLGYPLGAVGGGRGAHGGDEEKFLFPSTADAELELSKGQGGDTPGFWNGMLGGGGAW